ncbi:NAD(P)H-binding protein [Phytomonospora endophytica]|uniref:Uncharacterized protein YbjT (DUF2867 family) n=1 Tax=Phytomonospora endophytica TaxID=714109 RepID=A0A841FBH9_9ACTN|nr:NAD(P)H-binding protein [Phytomonospora endophytica]MBB6034631.1 uncharacterized protein YbjT (DUF2867 family) [Phytomonospora endophytica]GIG71309.1 NmrA family transcriptional regulator [Phytomonospora endophytica]
MIVVTGATGNVGRVLVGLLADTGEKIVAVSRTAAEGLPEGVEHRAADLGRPETLATAFDGADALFLFGGGDRPAEVVAAAKTAGITRVVLLSSQGAGTRPENPGHHGLRAFEAAVTSSGLSWTVLRPGGFASNAFAWAEPVRTARLAPSPFADVALPFVDPADIAAVAAAALTEPGHDGRTYVLTGPAALSPRERAAVIAEAVGAPVRLVEQTPGEARAQMLTFMPPEVVESTLDIIGSPTPAEQAVSPDIAAVLGREPGDFAGWVARNVVAFR